MRTSAIVVSLLVSAKANSACKRAGISGITCGPSDSQLFATGMNGDEDLGEDITMKGDKFHFAQNLIQINEPHPVLDATKPQLNGLVEKATYVKDPIDWWVPQSRKLDVPDHENGSTGIKTTLAPPEQVETLDPKTNLSGRTTFFA